MTSHSLTLTHSPLVGHLLTHHCSASDGSQANLKIKAVRDENKRELDSSNSALWAAVGALKKSLRGYKRRISAVKAQMMSRGNYLSARVSSLTSGLGRAKVGLARQVRGAGRVAGRGWWRRRAWCASTS